MAETITNTQNKRHTWIAVMLSLILPGLGQIYCGRLAKGLVFTVLNVLPVFLIIDILLLGNRAVLVLVVIGLLAFGGIIQLISIIDSIYLAGSIGSNYELKEYNRWYVYFLLILLVSGGSAVGVSPHRGNLIEAFRVTSASVYPTIFPGDRILANKTIYRKIEPRRGDLVVCLNPEKRRQNSIKRVVAIAGDTVEMRDNQLYVNGQILQRQPLSQTELEGFKINVRDPNFQGDVFYEINGSSRYKIFLAKTAGDEKMRNFPEMTVPKYNCFVLGDNRNDSYDSRNYGPIPVATIKGRADWLYWPTSRFSRLNAN